MSSIFKIAWLIPLFPLAVAFSLLILLISFNRTMNRLSKPVSYLLMISVALSTVISFIVFKQQLSGQITDWDLDILAIKIHLGLYIDDIAAKISTSLGVFALIIMASSFYLMDRKKGYVRYFISLSLSFGLVFLFVLSGDPFHSLFKI